MHLPVMSRRSLLRSGLVAGGSGALLLARPRTARSQGVGAVDAYGTSRRSRLFPNTTMVHADLHNHTLLSDGSGDPEQAYVSMRDAGLDVAALTDHATISQHLPASICGPIGGTEDAEGPGHDCQSLAGLHEGSWQRTAALADDVDQRGQFTAIRGFEWSSPTLGHMNVWFSQDWTDPLHTGGLGTPSDLVAFAEAEGYEPPGREALDALDEIIRAAPVAGAGMAAWYEWLRAWPDRPVHGGGADGVVGFNHPGREPGRFSNFAFDPALVDRVVSLELFNRRDDYLFELTDTGRRSPLVACLDAGWRPGILGVTDEHGTDWGDPDGKGRAGLWVDHLTRGGVREAMEARRFYATNLKGLRLDAAANGVRMGQSLTHRDGAVEIVIDLDRGPQFTGGRVGIQLLRTGDPLPAVVAAREYGLAAADDLIAFTVDVDVDDGDWLVLRVTDLEQPADDRADATYRAFGKAVAYASPWYLEPDAGILGR